jgi:hypothetical protein
MLKLVLLFLFALSAALVYQQDCSSNSNSTYSNYSNTNNRSSKAGYGKELRTAVDSDSLGAHDKYLDTDLESGAPSPALSESSRY